MYDQNGAAKYCILYYIPTAQLLYIQSCIIQVYCHVLYVNHAVLGLIRHDLHKAHDSIPV